MGDNPVILNAEGDAMAKTAVRLKITFDFELSVPETMGQLDHEALCKALGALLGPAVTQGMPTVSSKQLAKAGVDLVRHHHHLDARRLDAANLDRGSMIAAAPHLTDAELEKLGQALAGKVPGSGDEQLKFLRRKALALVSDYRLVDCIVIAKLTSGSMAELSATLNLTNGNILVADKDRQQRLKSDQGLLEVRIPGARTAVRASLSGQTLSGPVLGVDITELAAHRDALIACWQGR